MSVLFVRGRVPPGGVSVGAVDTRVPHKSCHDRVVTARVRGARLPRDRNAIQLLLFALRCTALDSRCCCTHSRSRRTAFVDHARCLIRRVRSRVASMRGRVLPVRARFLGAHVWSVRFSVGCGWMRSASRSAQSVEPQFEGVALGFASLCPRVSNRSAMWRGKGDVELRRRVSHHEMWRSSNVRAGGW